MKQELGTLTRFENAKIEIVELQELREQEIKVEEMNIIVPSLRLDNFVSDLARTSRSKAVQIIDSERVFINGQNETKASKQVKLGDVITIRGKGRFVVKEFLSDAFNYVIFIVIISFIAIFIMDYVSIRKERQWK